MSKNPVGRPSKLTPEIIEQAKNYCLLGATDVELASFFGVNPQTIYAWRNSNEDFATATLLGKEEANHRVGRSLYTRAVGYDKDGKHYPPDVKAQIFWLKNREPDQWKDIPQRPPSQTSHDEIDVNLTDLARRIVSLLQAGIDAASAHPQS